MKGALETQCIKSEVVGFWEAVPCGTRALRSPEGSPEFFNALEVQRDAREPFIREFARFSDRCGQKVLEVGVGAATDFIKFARVGARLTGVDLTSRSVRLARKRLAVEHLQGDALQADAEKLPFRDESFDFVYSWGVIHHTEDPQSAVNEIVRVTRPGGAVCVMIYHRHSLVSLQCWILNGLIKGRILRTFADVIYHHIESLGTKAYSRREARRMFASLKNLKVTPIVTPYDVRISRSKFLPSWFQALVPRQLGWFLVVQGRK